MVCCCVLHRGKRGRLKSAFNRNAGGRTSDLTSEMVKTCQSLIGIETCMHLTCTNMPKEKVDNALRVRIHSWSCAVMNDPNKFT